MLTAKEVTLLYETLLDNPWMEQTVKVELRISRRNVLALSKVIEIGLAEEKRTEDSLLRAAIREPAVLPAIPADIRKTANLTEMYEKISGLVAK
jgi:hypothetical protein